MKTNKIRIGTDVSLAVNLKQYFSNGALKEREVYNPDANDFYTIDENPYVNKKYELYYPNELLILIPKRCHSNPMALRYLLEA